LKSIFIVCAILVAVCANAGMNALTPAEKQAGWESLFDGETLNGWKATGNADAWAVQDGVIGILKNGGGYLGSVDTYGNFILSMEFKMDKACNSGIFIHWADLSNPVQRGEEIQIFDSFGKAKPDKHDCGAVYDCLAPSKQAAKPAGEWNKIVITCRNNLVIVDLNGKRIIYMNLDRWTTPHMNPDGTPNKFETAYKEMPRVGHIGLQDHGHKCWFRNIKIKVL
jgi:hypothetical protein